MADDAAPVIVDDRDQHRFVIEQQGLEAELVYRARPGRLTLVHTGVPEELAGRGLAGSLVRAAVGRASAEGLTIAPWCPYARKWLQDHPEEAAAVEIDWTPPVRHSG